MSLQILHSPLYPLHLAKENNIMQITLTSMQGNTRKINLNDKQEVYDFIELFKSTLHKNQRVKVTCDILGIDGYLQGEG